MLISKKQIADKAGISTRTLARYVIKLDMRGEIPPNMRLVPLAIANKLLSALACAPVTLNS